ncbi:uncharacterized protein BKCO1_27000103 [Diplodia corticola]|uniref:BZIP domain-containing protein n=1 Tax=Diplodia corticola TaxID=236234 RepID=A0A1J9QXV3_9PEZI|nr:uncharacterized protein BKCO1_27000103 [Diplodia corticola]OJD33862.1 hypothetical protein BKCO1_27000103 [Diplodia corticola]
MASSGVGSELNEANAQSSAASSSTDRKRVQNRIAQRTYRQRLKKRIEDLERRVQESNNNPQHPVPHPDTSWDHHDPENDQIPNDHHFHGTKSCPTPFESLLSPAFMPAPSDWYLQPSLDFPISTASRPQTSTTAPPSSTGEEERHLPTCRCSAQQQRRHLTSKRSSSSSTQPPPAPRAWQQSRSTTTTAEPHVRSGPAAGHFGSRSATGLAMESIVQGPPPKQTTTTTRMSSAEAPAPQSATAASARTASHHTTTVNFDQGTLTLQWQPRNLNPISDLVDSDMVLHDDDMQGDGGDEDGGGGELLVDHFAYTGAGAYDTPPERRGDCSCSFSSNIR